MNSPISCSRRIPPLPPPPSPPTFRYLSTITREIPSFPQPHSTYLRRAFLKQLGFGPAFSNRLPNRPQSSMWQPCFRYTAVKVPQDGQGKFWQSGESSVRHAPLRRGGRIDAALHVHFQSIMSTPPSLNPLPHSLNALLQHGSRPRPKLYERHYQAGFTGSSATFIN